MSSDVSSALSKAYEELRTIDMDLSMMSGINDRFGRKRGAGGDPSFMASERRVQDGGRKIVIGSDSSVKRGRYMDEAQDAGDHRHSQRDYSPPSSRPQRTLSSVVMPTTIETKSRAAVINEKKKNENKDDLVRNRRLFSNLLVGTLRQFQKEEKTVGNKGQAQIEKQREVERRLEETEKENRVKLLREREQLMARRREKEMEIQALRRQKAIEQSAEEKMKHFRRLACFIQTQTKPPLFFLPAKHSLRTLELLKDSSKKIEVLIELRREEMDRELKRLESYTNLNTSKDNNDGSDQEYDDDDDRKGLKSAIVVKNEQPDAVESGEGAGKEEKAAINSKDKEDSSEKNAVDDGGNESEDDFMGGQDGND